MKMQSTALAFFLAFAACLMAFPAACKTVDRLGNIENLPPEDIELTEANVASITRALVGVAVTEGHVSPLYFTKAADIIEMAALDLETTYGNEFIEDLMVKSGLTKDEAHAIWIIVGQQIKFELGVPKMPIGPNLRHLMKVFATALRDGAQGRATEEDKRAAERAVNSK